MGNKYDLISDIFKRLPDDSEIDTFYDLFGGSGVVSANMIGRCKTIVYNEYNENIYRLYDMFVRCKDEYGKDLIDYFHSRITEFNLVYDDVEKSKINNNVDLRKGEKEYLKFRDFYNESSTKDIRDVFLLSNFSFCNLIRFNGKGEFNVPYGNRKYLKNKHDAEIKTFVKHMKSGGDVITKNENAFDVLDTIIAMGNKKDFVYLDPPYSNTTAIYNEQRKNGDLNMAGWTIKDDVLLMQKCDELTNSGIKWMMSNVLFHKGKHNDHLEKWAKDKGYVISLINDKEYASLGKGNALTQEIVITNYEPTYKIFDLFTFGDNDE